MITPTNAGVVLKLQPATLSGLFKAPTGSLGGFLKHSKTLAAAMPIPGYVAPEDGSTTPGMAGCNQAPPVVRRC
jgi:hypothetical protein